MDDHLPQNEPWYAVKEVFHNAPNDIYEERIVLFRASGFDDAIAQAEVEAEEYCSDLDGVSFVRWIDVYHLFDEKVVSGSEVYSEIVDSKLSPEAYIKNHYPHIK